MTSNNDIELLNNRITYVWRQNILKCGVNALETSEQNCGSMRRQEK